MKKTDILSRRVEKVLPSAEGLSQLMSSRKIRLYQGFDPTGTKLHLGHAIGLKKLMEFANAGHEVIFLFGTGTVLVGDPSQRDSARQAITQAEITHNIKDWKRQVAPLVDFKKVTIKQNGDWLTKMTLKDIVGVASQISAIQLFKRDSFQRRLDKGDTVWYHETMYPLLQGYDSVAMDVDLEIGGTDQEFNMLIGRELQKKLNQKDKYVLTLPMILGIDGQPMSKTSGNCVWLDDSPSDMFGKIMRLPDSQIMNYFVNVTDVDEAALAKYEKQAKTKPREVKAALAHEIVSMLHGQPAAASAMSAFDSQFKDKALPADIPEVKIKTGQRPLAEALVDAKLAATKSQARRLIQQGGVKLNQQVVSSDSVELSSGDVLQVGKRKFAKLK
jgi:tyrosyl-tRNA synthetase